MSKVLDAPSAGRLGDYDMPPPPSAFPLITCLSLFYNHDLQFPRLTRIQRCCFHLRTIIRITNDSSSDLEPMSQHPQARATGRAPAPSQTITQTNGEEGTSSDTVTAAPRILRLRGRHEPDGRTVQWADDVVDNEGLGRKSSKGEGG
jgi:hypothetical protein